MGFTINSTTTAYATQADFLLFCDSNFLGDLVGDLGVRTDLSATGGDANDPVIQMHLLRATGRIESECIKADLYSPTDLAALAVSGTASASLLKWMTCALAAITLRGRRQNLEEPDPPYKKEVLDLLGDISDGKEVFGFVEVEGAGAPATYTMSYQDYLNLNYLTNNTRFWGNVTPQACDVPGGVIR